MSISFVTGAVNPADACRLTVAVFSRRCRTLYRLSVLAIAVGFGFLTSGPATAQQTPATGSVLQAGAAATNITPPLGGGIVGGFLPIPSKDIHDELHARCLVLDDGKNRVALVVCDLLGIHRSVSDEARRLIEERLQIPAAHVLISATHTHSACSALGSSRYSFDSVLDDYQRFVAIRIADGVQRAVQNLRPAELAFTTTDIPEHVFNRRWFMAEGTVPVNPFGEYDQVKMNPPGGSPNLIRPAGPVDPTVSIIAVREPMGAPIGLYAAYSLHYVGGVGPGHISADYYGEFCRRLTQLMEVRDQDPEFVPMMANGTSGNINNINFRQPRPRKQPYEQIRYVAHDVAEKVHAALKDVSWRSEITVDGICREAEIGWRRPTELQLARAKAILAEPAPTTGRADLPRIYAERTLSMAGQPETAPVPIQVLRIGEIGIGTLPCEVFCEIGIEFRERCPLKPAFMVSLGHGYFGYLPTPEQHLLGGYETWLGTNRMEIEASVKLLDQLVEMAGEISP